MKKATVMFLLCVVTGMFVTGCNSLFASGKAEFSEITSSVAATEADPEAEESESPAVDENGNIVSMLDYFEMNMAERFSNLEGTPAFQIREGHSDSNEDIEDFQIGDLLSDGTFIYAYTTLVSSGSYAGKMVHCAAFYNYKSGDLRVFHENYFDRESDEEESTESLSLQICGEGDDMQIFIYDNGCAFLYNARGEAVLVTDVESFARSQYPDVHSVTVVHALYDGENRFYLELAIEKEELDLGEEDETDIDSDYEEDEDDEEMEEAESEAEDKLEDLILVYEFSVVSSDLYQYNTAFENQKAAWIAMTKDVEYTEAPDGVADWTEVLSDIPDQWGQVYMPGKDNLGLSTWVDGVSFETYEDGYLCSFVASSDKYQDFTNLTLNTNLNDVFTVVDGHYSQISGTTGDSFSMTDAQTFKRTYILVTYEEEEDEEGNTKKKKVTTTCEQTLSNVYVRRYCDLNNSSCESYWVLEEDDDDDITTLGEMINGGVLCASEETLYWIDADGDISELGELGEDSSRVELLTDNGTVWLVIPYLEHMVLTPFDAESASLRTSDMVVLQYEEMTAKIASGVKVVVEEEDTSEEESTSEEEATSEETKSYESDVLNDLLAAEVESGGSAYLTAENVLPISLHADREKATRLIENGGTALLPADGSNTCSGWLLTSESSGLAFYDPVGGQGIQLDAGTWYRTWKQNDACISVGFSSSSSYSALDVAFARVYEYDPDEWYSDSVDETLELLDRSVENSE
ncbi:MAG: hypothetical protein LUE86_03035 [Clostridiales bacterium]|nr:hypothetical protein [Clostridiales bacterium]